MPDAQLQSHPAKIKPHRKRLDQKALNPWSGRYTRGKRERQPQAIRDHHRTCAEYFARPIIGGLAEEMGIIRGAVIEKIGDPWSPHPSATGHINRITLSAGLRS